MYTSRTSVVLLINNMLGFLAWIEDEGAQCDFQIRKWNN
jgi:hypothetical protein